MSKLEDVLMLQIIALKMRIPEREHRFHSVRRFRFDFAYPEKKIAIEVEGGTWGKSRHTSGIGYKNDCEKYNLAAIDGWYVLRVTGDHIKSGLAIDWIAQILKIRG